jgi:hypothetical protein
LQAGGRRFESDHLHHDPGFTDRGGEVVGEVVRVYRGEAKVIGIDGSAPEESQDGTAMLLASPREMPVFVRVNQVLVRLWAYLLACLTGCAVLHWAASSEQGIVQMTTVVC